MNAVLGFAQMLQYDPQHPLLPTQNEYVENILEGGGHLLKLINQILDLARIEADQTSLSLEELNANAVVTVCLNLIRPLGKTNGVTIASKLDGKPLSFLRTDSNRFKQVLINLISNAVKYNKDGGTVTIDGHETDDKFLHISVSDTGHGIDKDDYPGVFQTFNRLHADPMTAKEGTGIGLSVSKMLVEQMSGRIGFDSEVGTGSTFWFELPLATNEDVLIWADSLRVGVDAIDRDHQTLILFTNKLSYSSIDEHEVGDVIGNLIDYAHFHFRREEEIMRVCDYPGLEIHRDFHRDLAAQIHELSESWRKEQNQETLHNLRKFMRDWLIGHVKHEDTKITLYTKGKGEDITQALETLKLARNITSQTIQ
ncbi:bacteriohemerythrin [Magnetovibrio blakemorei]|nr:bacteriohemerythrin [Magnetovibrio blakemorei]